MPNAPQKLVPIAIALVLAIAPLAAADVVIGKQGQTFSVLGGTYGALVPEGSATGGENPVLMLETRLPGQEPKLLLVPGTEDAQWEEAPTLVYEDASDTLFLVWIGRVSTLHPVVSLIGYGPDGWTEHIELVGNPFVAKSHPAVAVTRDSFLRLDPLVGPVESLRTVVHLVWAQEEAADQWAAVYAPVMFVDGAYTRHSPILHLEDVLSEVGADDIAVATPHWTAPVLRPGRDTGTVIIGFASSTGSRFRTAEIHLVPADLIRLAGDARAHIIDTGARVDTPEGRRLLADGARAHIIDTGIAFDVNIVRSLADAARAYIVDSGGTIASDDELRRVADGARAHIIDTGVSLSHGLRRAVVQASRSTLVQVSADEGGEHFLAFGSLSSRPTPAAATEESSVFLSRRGSDAIVAWSDDARVFYLESEGDAWSEVRTIELGTRLGVAEALEGLERRIGDR